MKRVFRRPSPAMVIAIVALIAALGGTAIGASFVTKKQTKKIAKNQVKKLAPGLSVASAKKADDADKLGGAGAAAYQTAAASDLRSDTNALTTSNETVLSANITLPAAKTVTAIASVEAVADGGGNDNINCNVNIAGTDGARQSTYITPNGLENSTTLPLTQSLALGAGTHTVIVECSEGATANTSVEDRSLSVVSTG
ncbi:MAG TPA: hypothetical protein VIZ61_01950 [Solirubrobacterales bacterium]